MTKKHFIAIANAFRIELDYLKCFPGDRSDAAKDHLENLARKLCTLFKQDNSRFDSERFMKACGISDS